MSYSFHRGAAQDLHDAAQFYQREAGAKVASRFLNEFERVTGLLVEFPDIGTPSDDQRRTYPLRDFPYSIIYRQISGHIRILVIRHQHRDPEHGELRR